MTIDHQGQSIGATVMTPHRRLTIGAVLVAALIGCQSSPAGEPSASPSGSAASVAPSPSASASAPVAACDDDATHAAGAVALRLEHFTETGRDWVISVHDDGRLLTPGITPYELSDEAWMLVRWLTDAGVDALVAEADATGQLETSASYAPVPLPGVEPPGRGASGFKIVLGNADPVVVTWTSIFPDEAKYYQPSPEREALDALAADLLALDSWLTDQHWASPVPCPYRPPTYRVVVLDPQRWGGSLDDLPADVEDVPWPLGGDIWTWGEAFNEVGTDPDPDGRCDVVSSAEAETLVTELAAAGAEASASADDLGLVPFVELSLSYRAETSFVQVAIRPLLPDEAGCAGASFAPFGI